MTAFVIRRVLQAVLVLFATSVIVFVGVYAIGDPLEILLPGDASAAERAQVAESLNLNDPLPVQYLRFVSDALTGDFGRSFVYNRPAAEVILERLPAPRAGKTRGAMARKSPIECSGSRSADFIKASSHVLREQAVHVTAAHLVAARKPLTAEPVHTCAPGAGQFGPQILTGSGFC